MEAGLIQEHARRSRLGLWLFFASEVFLFGALLAVRFHLWGPTRPTLDQGLGVTVTSILLASSFFMNRAEVAIGRGDRANFLVSLLITGALGTAFLGGVIGFEWRGELRPQDGVHGSILFAMTGLHAFHVLSGLALIGLVLVKSLSQTYGPDRHWGVEGCAIYWHFVDLVWVFYFPALYLMGSPVGT
jgi:cytochrome c oxidase subunit 3